jgi:AraC family transcriptional regulator
MAELGLADTNGILAQPWVRAERTSAGLGWADVYVSKQRELPFKAEFDSARTHQLILHLGGPVTVQRGRQVERRVPAGGLFLQPAHSDLAVRLFGELDTLHVYLADSALPDGTELAEELGSTDPLLEQLMLTLDSVVRDWEPSARTYVDELTALLTSQLARKHSTTPSTTNQPRPSGLSDRQFRRVRELIAERLAEPVPLAELAATAGLSVSQFSRQFKVTSGLAPHRYLLRARLRQASLLLRTSTQPIADIALRCGFSHQEHLTRVMRAHLGTTPAALRRNG